MFVVIATNMMEDILQHNNKVNEILINLESISNNLDELTKLLSPTTPDKFERKWNEIEVKNYYFRSNFPNCKTY